MNRKVYSSEGGRLCPDCGEPADGCRCAATPAVSRGSGRVRVGRETKGRRGKAVTVVSGLPLGAADLADLAKALKARCGAGGTVRDVFFECQGDHRDKVVEKLCAMGYRAKAGGG